jgi:hypothetical protein
MVELDYLDIANPAVGELNVDTNFIRSRLRFSQSFDVNSSNKFTSTLGLDHYTGARTTFVGITEFSWRHQFNQHWYSNAGIGISIVEDTEQTPVFWSAGIERRVLDWNLLFNIDGFILDDGSSSVSAGVSVLRQW